MKNSSEHPVLTKEQIDSVLALYSKGQYQEAIDKIKVLNEKYPNVPLLFNLIGACYKALGELIGASQMFEKAITLKSDYAEAYKNLGITLKDLGQLDAAVNSLKKSITIEPNYLDAHYNLAITFRALNQLDDAANSYEKAILIKPNFAEAHNNLGNALKDLDQLDDAIKSYNKAVDINQNFAEAYYNLGVVFRQLKKFDEAIKNFETAISINPNFAEAHNNLGECLTSLGFMVEAIDCFEKAINFKPDYAEAHKNIGFNLFSLGKTKGAAKFFEKAIAIEPNYAEAHSKLGHIYKKLKQSDKARLSYERAYKIKPKMDFILGDILNNKMHLSDWFDLANLLKEVKKKIVDSEKVISPFFLLGLIDNPGLQRKASEIYSSKKHPKSYTLKNIKPYPKHKKIRIGYFSSDFKIHPVAYLTAGLYELHNREHFEVHAFSLGPDTSDEMNLRIKAGVDHFHDVRSMSHKEIALLARSLEIDIAVDLAGYTAKSRTDVFAMSAAPIQLSYIGFLGTMGADYYDYLIADPIMIPEKNKKDYSEKIVYLPNFQVNDSKDSPSEITLTRKELGLPEKGFVFCCFNNTYKFTPTVFDSWARILKQVEGSVLIIYASNESSKANLVKEIALREIDPSRLIFGGRLVRPEYLARYKAADLFLDTTPYNAGTTASDALRMGLPVLTCIGKSYSARMGASILSSLNLPELITTTSKEYEALAIELATNPEKFKKLKDKLTSNLSTAPLFDTPLFTKNIESAYTTMYERHRQGLEADHIYVKE
ncbi:tetratricopeptide repeat protein [Candidatus Pseudothioglobus sp. Uisw_016]|uniref:tetratricopeptide repeat protein n=1 Tax=Candidatus Pseudothioglobus sp. Uisw_016 TaxID=3230995 RepID=UPI003A86290C